MIKAFLSITILFDVVIFKVIINVISILSIMLIDFLIYISSNTTQVKLLEFVIVENLSLFVAIMHSSIIKTIIFKRNEALIKILSIEKD